MNIEAYDAEALRSIVRLLEYENRILKDKLKKENIPYDEINPFEESSLKTACETDGPHSGDRREEHGSCAGKWRHIDAVTGRT